MKEWIGWIGLIVDRLIEMIGLMVDRFDRVDRLIVDGMNRLMEWIYGVDMGL